LNGDYIVQKEVMHTGDNTEKLLAALTDFRARVTVRKLRSMPMSDECVDSLLEQLAYLKAEQSNTNTAKGGKHYGFG
jgi:cation transport regulator ChaC